MRGQLPLLLAAAAAGSAPETGVYVGIQQMEYAGLAAPHLHSFGPYNASGSPFSIASGRLSFTYGLKGGCGYTCDSWCGVQLRMRPQRWSAAELRICAAP